MNTNIILSGNPSLGSVKNKRAAFEQLHGPADLYYSGAVFSLDEDAQEYTFPDALHVGTIDDESFSLLILDNLCEWFVEPVAPYSFELVKEDALPSRPVYAVPADTLWPEWATSFRQTVNQMDTDHLLP